MYQCMYVRQKPHFRQLHVINLQVLCDCIAWSCSSEQQQQPAVAASVVMNGRPLTDGERPARIYIYSGRPIPDYASVKTPEQSRAADRQLREAKAAVDIQRSELVRADTLFRSAVRDYSVSCCDFN